MTAPDAKHPASLKMLAQVFELQVDDDEQLTMYYDTSNGEILGPDPKAPPLPHERIDFSDPKYVRLPDRAEIDEPEMMKQFAKYCATGAEQKQLLAVLKKGGEDLWDLRERFEAALQPFELEMEWEEFRIVEYYRAAGTWCEQHGIPIYGE